MDERLKPSAKNQASMNAYIEYFNVVGNADGGKLFTPEQYEAFKADLKKNAKFRVYTSWRNAKSNKESFNSSQDIDCKMIGPETKCICDHRYKDHNYTNAPDKKVHCKAKNCPCASFYYIPVHGSSDFKCLCKASYKLHDPVTKKCPIGKSGSATGKFSSTWSCSCGYKFGEHMMIFESREDRIAAGKPVDDVNRMMGEFNALTSGGLTSFTQLADGAERYENYMNTGPNPNLKAIGGGTNQQKALKNDFDDQDGPLQISSKQIKNPKEEVKKNKLSNLNQKLDTEKKISSYMIGKDPNTVSNTKYEDYDEGGEALTALDLYNQPHSYMRVKINIKKR